MSPPKPRGRPRGTGKKEDEPILREAYRAFRGGEFRSKAAVVAEYAKRLPGGDTEANRSRLYRKILKREKELQAELEREEGRITTMDEQAEQIASELADLPGGVKEERLFHLLQILIENTQVEREVLRRLKEDGLDAPPEFLSYLNSITTKIVKKERAAFESSGKARILKMMSEQGLKRKGRRKY